MPKIILLQNEGFTLRKIDVFRASPVDVWCRVHEAGIVATFSFI